MTNALAGKMDKSANGADIADISEFLNNLGLGLAPLCRLVFLFLGLLQQHLPAG